MSSDYQAHKNLGKCNVCPKNAHCATITLFLNLRLLSLLQGTWAGTKKDTFLYSKGSCRGVSAPCNYKITLHVRAAGQQPQES